MIYHHILVLFTTFIRLRVPAIKAKRPGSNVVERAYARFILYGWRLMKFWKALGLILSLTHFKPVVPIDAHVIPCYPNLSQFDIFVTNWAII